MPLKNAYDFAFYIRWLSTWFIQNLVRRPSYRVHVYNKKMMLVWSVINYIGLSSTYDDLKAKKISEKGKVAEHKNQEGWYLNTLYIKEHFHLYAIKKYLIYLRIILYIVSIKEFYIIIKLYIFIYKIVELNIFINI